MRIRRISRSTISKAVVALLIALVFVELGIWQLHRAQDVNKAGKITVSKDVAKLEDISTAGANLPPSAANRMVEMSGRYVKAFSAPNQLVVRGNGSAPATLEVRLLKISGDRGILVVRGIENTKFQTLTEDVKVVGRLYPRQTSDKSQPSGNSLTRLDPGLVTGVTKLSLYDGYVIAQLESTTYGLGIRANRIPAPIQISKVAGYYWQHITYVFIWWLLALLVLSAPFYNRLRDKIGA